MSTWLITGCSSGLGRALAEAVIGAGHRAVVGSAGGSPTHPAWFKNLEAKGNPWGQNNSSRMDWAKDLPFEVPEFDGETVVVDGQHQPRARPVADAARANTKRSRKVRTPTSVRCSRPTSSGR